MSVTPPRIYNVKTKPPRFSAVSPPDRPTCTSGQQPWRAVVCRGGPQFRQRASLLCGGVETRFEARRGAGPCGAFCGSEAPLRTSKWRERGGWHHCEEERTSMCRCAGLVGSGARSSLEGWNVRMYIYGGGEGALASSVASGIQARDIPNTATSHIYKPTARN